MGDTAHPANFGRLCSKGAALAETLDDAGRLLHPTDRRRTGELGRGARPGRRSASPTPSPSTARTASRFYVSGQCLTEDYYVANKLMKGFIGSANIDTNSRLCMASTVAGHVRAFGADIVPGVYEDLGAGRPRRAGRQQPRLVPPGAAPAPEAARERARHAGRGRSIRAGRRRPRAPTCICRWRRAADVALFAGLLAHLDRGGRDRPRLGRGARRRASTRRWQRARGIDVAGITGLDPGRHRNRSIALFAAHATGS